ncbi:RNA polymerase recycling motor HelD [Alkalihalobacillus sp. AL-G]|uniref:RNA polymerase recycling motor HelD n=1 Tax=Alkalihalobacillus sp. AL-G TaxID=2926399 RepID=UPI002729A8AB|nr:RNA polymerase recycling motor HelD [Alkalihalobacillus sp. AL-G]WLD91627.1 AAA family ATPase [Alkalihalobacillus sp. AL-G]
MTENNKERKQEQQRIDLILSLINKKMLALSTNVGSLKQDIVSIRKSFWDDVKINIDNPDEVIETVTSIRQQAEFLSERERSHRQSYNHHKNLNRLKYSPYFGRIDFKEDQHSKSEPIYLGITSLMDEKEEDFLIYDWRAPISSLYYDYSPGLAKYETPGGTISGKMELKRQYIIQDGRINSMFDTDITVGDELLQEVLGNNANTKMKSIVATIQKEQNQIIRNEKSKLLIVQGVAGSGKTSAALQRIAYLLYRYRKTMNSENIMLFSPNDLFNSYVATVLPELGEDNMIQTTFQKYIETRLQKQFEIEDPFQQMEYLLTSMDDPNFKTRMDAIKYKASLDFKQLIDRYVESLAQKNLIFNSITFKGDTLISAEQVHDYFYSLDPSISIPNRIQLVSEWLSKEIAKFEHVEQKKDWVIEECELLEKEDYLEAYSKLQKGKRWNEDTFDDIDREQELLAKELVKRYFRPVKKTIKQLKFINMTKIYQQLFEQWELNSLSFPTIPSNWNDICKHSLRNLSHNRLLYEDTTPYLYLQDQLEGRKSNTMIRHLFIDEAQDYSPFQFAFLQQIFPNCRMTILGDLNQAIYAHTLNAPTLLNNTLFELEKQEKITLTRSYRSTRQIVEFTKGLIDGGERIEAFNRNGQKPSITIVEGKQSLHSKIMQRLQSLKNDNHPTIAIICKTAQESINAFNDLSHIAKVQLMVNETDSYTKGILILPAYLAKGIEFDAVIIYNGSKEQYCREYERKLFYTACTRAMHELHIFSISEKSPFMDNVSEEKYSLT